VQWLRRHVGKGGIAAFVGVILAWLMKRRIDHARAQLFASIPPRFFQPIVMIPPSAAIADSSAPHSLSLRLPPPSASLGDISVTHGVWSFLPLRFQWLIRDRMFRPCADLAAWMGGALVIGWRPSIIRRMFFVHEGRTFDQAYGEHPRQKIDIYHRRHPHDDTTRQPHTMSTPAAHTASSLSLMQMQGTSSTSRLVPSSSYPLRPIIVFMHGGAWGSGNKAMYRLLGDTLNRSLNCVVMILGYRTYPDTDVEGQVEDVHRALIWVRQNAHRWEGDTRRIFLSGHSSGAHISTLYVLRQIAHHQHSRSSTDESLPIAGVIGMGGPYDITEHYFFESARGVMELSPMKAAAGDMQRMHRHSCLSLASNLTPAQRSRLPPFLLLHGMSDPIVPYTSTLRMGCALAGWREATMTAPEQRHDASSHTIIDKASVQMETPSASVSVPTDGKHCVPMPVALPALPSHRFFHASESVASAAASSSFPHSFTFPTNNAAHPSLPLPLIHVRTCGAYYDPRPLDHAASIVGLLTYDHESESQLHRVRNNGQVHPFLSNHGGHERTASDVTPREAGQSSLSSGHARWVLESIDAFFHAIEQQRQHHVDKSGSQRVEQADTPTEVDNATRHTQPLRSSL